VSTPASASARRRSRATPPRPRFGAPARSPRRTSTGKPTLTDFTGHVLLETDYIPADTIFFITLIEGVGGSPAGAGNVWVEVDWF
jgi:hypothetical protein